MRETSHPSRYGGAAPCRFRSFADVLRAAELEITVREALEQAPSSEFRTWLVTDRRGVIGVINLSRLERELTEGADKKLAELVDALVFPHVHADQGLDLALERMGVSQIEILPVVSRADVHKLEGIVTLRDVLDAYGVSRARFGLRLIGGIFRMTNCSEAIHLDQETDG